MFVTTHDDLLRRRLLADLPGLLQLPPLEQVNTLRNWAFRNQVLATPSTCLPEEAWKGGGGAGELYYRLSLDEGGLFCAGAAQAFRLLCELFGYRAGVYNAGAAGGLASHVVTLVEVEHNGLPVWWVQDSYFNYALVDEEGAPVSLWKARKFLSQRQHHKLHRLPGPDKCCILIADSAHENLHTRHERFFQSRFRLAEKLSGGRRKGSYRWGPDVLEDPVFQHYPQWIEKRTGQRDMLYLFLYTVTWAGPTDLAMHV